MPAWKHSRDFYSIRLTAAREKAAAVAESGAYRDFVEVVRTKSPWRFKGATKVERFLRGVAHHLLNFIPKLLACAGGDIRTIFDFGCGSGSSSIALTMVFPGAHCHGVDINSNEVSIARARAKLYGVNDRCRFDCIGEEQPLPFDSDQFDLCTCCSVLESVTDPAMRKFCVREMARVIAPGGMLFVSVSNRLYPFEIHTRKFGWNYFPKLRNA